MASRYSQQITSLTTACQAYSQAQPTSSSHTAPSCLRVASVSLLRTSSPTLVVHPCPSYLTPMVPQLIYLFNEIPTPQRQLHVSRTSRYVL